MSLKQQLTGMKKATIRTQNTLTDVAKIPPSIFTHKAPDSMMNCMTDIMANIMWRTTSIIQKNTTSTVSIPTTIATEKTNTSYAIRMSTQVDIMNICTKKDVVKIESMSRIKAAVLNMITAKIYQLTNSTNIITMTTINEETESTFTGTKDVAKKENMRRMQAAVQSIITDRISISPKTKGMIE